MKKFVNVEIELISFEMIDIISTSFWGPDPGPGEEDKLN